MLKNWKRELAVSCRWFLVWADPWLWEPIQPLEHDILLATCRHPVLVIGQNVIFIFFLLFNFIKNVLLTSTFQVLKNRKRELAVLYKGREFPWVANITSENFSLEREHFCDPCLDNVLSAAVFTLFTYVKAWQEINVYFCYSGSYSIGMHLFTAMIYYYVDSWTL